MAYISVVTPTLCVTQFDHIVTASLQ